jgi:hypothetical protein
MMSISLIVDTCHIIAALFRKRTGGIYAVSKAPGMAF